MKDSMTLADASSSTTEPPPTPAADTNGQGKGSSPEAVDHGHATDSRGAPFDRHHPYLVGLSGAFGVITAYLAYRAISDIADVLLLVGIALFLAIGFEPVVSRVSRRLPRIIAVLLVVATITAILVAFVVLALPPIVQEVTALTKAWPKYRRQIVSGQGTVGKLAARAHLRS